jgi:hypothetical protein
MPVTVSVGSVITGVHFDTLAEEYKLSICFCVAGFGVTCHSAELSG